MLNDNSRSEQPIEITPEMTTALNWIKYEERKDRDIDVVEVINAVRRCKMSVTREAGDPFCADCPYWRYHVPGEGLCDRKLLEDAYAVLLDQHDAIVDLWWQLNHMDEEEESDDAE